MLIFAVFREICFYRYVFAKTLQCFAVQTDLR